MRTETRPWILHLGSSVTLERTIWWSQAPESDERGFQVEKETNMEHALVGLNSKGRGGAVKGKGFMMVWKMGNDSTSGHVRAEPAEGRWSVRVRVRPRQGSCSC